MAVEDMSLSENEIFDELDQYFYDAADQKDPDEFWAGDVCKHYGMTRRAALSKLNDMEENGLLTSRMLKLTDSKQARKYFRFVTEGQK